MSVPRTTHTCLLTRDQGEALRVWARENGCRMREVPHAEFAAEKGAVNFVWYKSRKLVVQGKGTGEFVEFVLEPVILQEARIGYETVLNPELLLPRLGVDESGKGDFFGPMCVAGVYLNESMLPSWKEAGVRDSKQIGSDRRIGELADVIRGTPGCVFRVVTIGNAAYNRLFAKLQSANKILAWGHARVIENLLLQQHRMQPLPVRAIVDQFASTEETVSRALMSLGRDLKVVQRHKAESDLAVAAASILARDEFVRRLAQLSKDLGLPLPKGASAAVEDAGRAVVARYGPERLADVAKMHFRTSCRVLGQPEPPRVEWRPRRRSNSPKDETHGGAS